MLPALAAMTAGLIAMAAIEFFDFDFQIPANLIAFAVLTGLALRMSIPPEPPKEGRGRCAARGRPLERRILYLPMAGAIGLAIFAMTQSGLPYPFDIATPASVSDARSLLLSYPYNPGSSSSDTRALRRCDGTCDAIARTRDLGVARSHRSACT